MALGRVVTESFLLVAHGVEVSFWGFGFGLFCRLMG